MTSPADAPASSVRVVTADAEHPAVRILDARGTRRRFALAAGLVALAAVAVWAFWPIAQHADPHTHTGASPASTRAAPPAQPPVPVLATLWPDPVKVERAPVRVLAILPGLPASAFVSRVADGATVRVVVGTEIDTWRVTAIGPASLSVQSASGEQRELMLDAGPQDTPTNDRTRPARRRTVGGNAP